MLSRACDRFDPATELYESQILAVGGSSVKSHLRRVDLCVKRLKQNGLWAKLAPTYLLAAPDRTTAKINLKTPGTHNLAESGTVTFTENVGFASNGTDGFLTLGTGFETYLAQDDNHLGAWCSGTATVTNTWGRTDTNGRFSLAQDAADLITVRLATSTASTLGANTVAAGYFVATRRGSTEVEGYKDGASNGTDNDTSLGVGTGNALLLQSASAFSSSTMFVEIAHMGTGLTGGEVATLHSIFAAYRNNN